MDTFSLCITYGVNSLLFWHTWIALRYVTSWSFHIQLRNDPHTRSSLGFGIWMGVFLLIFSPSEPPPRPPPSNSPFFFVSPDHRFWHGVWDFTINEIGSPRTVLFSNITSQFGRYLAWRWHECSMDMRFDYTMRVLPLGSASVFASSALLLLVLLVPFSMIAVVVVDKWVKKSNYDFILSFLCLSEVFYLLIRLWLWSWWHSMIVRHCGFFLALALL